MIEIIQSGLFSKWLSKLKDAKAKTIVLDRLVRLQGGNAGDVKALGSAVYELRIHYGPGYRLYFTRRGNVLVVMLVGGDKSSQVRDIEKAKAMAKEWEDHETS